MKITKRLCHLLQGKYANKLDSFSFTDYRLAYIKTSLLVQVFYVYLLYRFGVIIQAYLWLKLDQIPHVDPLWPVFWLHLLDEKIALQLITLVTIISTVWVLIQPYYRLARVLVFISYLVLAGLTYSFGKISHGDHMLLGAAFMFIWLPDKMTRPNNSSVTQTHSYLTGFWSAQLMIALFYTMSGLWKIYAGIEQFAQGQLHTFHPYALANLVAFRLLQTNQESMFGWFIIDYPLLGWPMHLGAIYLETGSIITVFRPQLHRIWGMGLILLHIGTWFLIDVFFVTNVFLIGLLFVLSPFTPAEFKWRRDLGYLPLIGVGIRWGMKIIKMV